jgi:PAS domain S-box-containing protein
MKEDGELFRAIYDSVSDGIVLLDPGTARTLSANRAASEMFGYTLEELQQIDIVDVSSGIAPFTQEDALMWIGRAVAGEPQSVEWQGKNRSGRVFWIDANLRPVTIQGRKLLILSVRDIDKRKCAEEELRTSETRYHTLFKNMREGFAYCRGVFEDGRLRDYIHIEVNEAFERLTGLASVAGKGINELIPGLRQSNPELFEIYGRVALSGKSEKFEMEVAPLKAWYSISVYSPKAEYFVVVFDNITSRKNAEKKLRQLSVVTEQSPASIVITNPAGEIEYVNRKFETLTGYSRAEVIGKNPRILKSEKLPAENYGNLWNTILSGKEWRGEFLNRKKNGESYWELASINPILNENGEITHFLAVKEDITERKQAESLIRESEERFRLITSSIEEVFWISTSDLSRMVYVSPAYEQIWGMPARTAYENPKSFLDSIHPEDVEKVVTSLDRKKTGQPFVIEYRIVRPDGAIRWINDRGYPVKDAEGRMSRYAGVAQDITEARKLEERFLRAQRMESIGTLAGGIAHDLNNILAPILMGCELLTMDLPEEKKKELLANMQSCAERGSEIVKQVLSFARGSEGRRIRVQPRHLIKDVEKITSETFPKNIRLFLRLDSPLMEIVCDPTQIHQVLLNLCVNARDAMATGGELTLSAGNQEIDEQFASMQPGAKPGPHVLIKVSDTGTGIDPEVLDKIFDPFFTTKEVGKGTGLGLSTVLGIVKSHGGFVNVYSEPGRGSTFRVYLPAVAAASPGISGENESEDRPCGNGETILVVEDEPLILSATRYVLESHGYHVLDAMDGAEAVAVFVQHQNNVAAVLMDMMMPVMGGLAAIQALKRASPGVKIIATSGLWSKEQISSVNATGVTHVLVKPFKTEVLLTTLHKMLH